MPGCVSAAQRQRAQTLLKMFLLLRERHGLAGYATGMAAGSSRRPARRAKWGA